MTMLVTGGTGMVGKAIEKIKPEAIFIGSKDFDLTDEKQTSNLFLNHKPKHVIHLAAKVGGVKSNLDYTGDFYFINSKINNNVLNKAKTFQVEKVVSLLSTCVYPDVAHIKYPLTEDQLHLGPPHKSNFGYAYAKRMVDVMSRAYRKQYKCNFITAIPNNLYGENDNFHLQNSHVIPAIIRKVWEAKINGSDVVKCWGDGSPLREFTYSQDIAKILLFLLNNYDGPDPINIGNAVEHTISEIVYIICNILEYDGTIVWQTDKPAGQYRKPSSNQKLLDIGWKKEWYTPLEIGLKKTCDWFRINYPNVRGV